MVEALLVATMLAVTQVEDADADPDSPAVPVAPEDERPVVPGLVSLLDYQISQVTRIDVAGGKTKVAVESNAPSPRAGSFPVRFFIDNTKGPRQVVSLSIRSTIGGSLHTVGRSVEVEAGERRTVNVPVPSEMRYGNVSATGPGITEDAHASMYFQATYDPQRVVLSISQPEAFEKFIGKAPHYSGANVLVHAIPVKEAPGELASYLGYDAIVVPDATSLDALDEAQRGSIEAFAASGGHLIIGGKIRSAAMFPLARILRPGTNDYGFGKLSVAEGASTGDLEVFRETFTVNPKGPLPEYERKYNSGAAELLLPQATAPLGRFLFIIALFTLAIGPGSVWVARRRGPAALLVTIPGTAIITCAMIIGYSIIADGFTVHTSTYAYSLLDSRSHRLVTQSLTAYYANLAPSKTTFGSGTVLVAPWDDRRDRYVADMNWKDGLTLGGDFVPSRTYREWGFVSVEPSRARVVVKQKGGAWVLQNALGAPIEQVVIDVDGKFFTGGPVRDGGEVELTAGNKLPYSGARASDRFSARVIQVVGKHELQHREFLARLEGPGLVPNGGVRSEQHGGEQWLRGEFEE